MSKIWCELCRSGGSTPVLQTGGLVVRYTAQTVWLFQWPAIYAQPFINVWKKLLFTILYKYRSIRSHTLQLASYYNWLTGYSCTGEWSESSSEPRRFLSKSGLTMIIPPRKWLAITAEITKCSTTCSINGLNIVTRIAGDLALSKVSKPCSQGCVQEMSTLSYYSFTYGYSHSLELTSNMWPLRDGAHQLQIIAACIISNR